MSTTGFGMICLADLSMRVGIDNKVLENRKQTTHKSECLPSHKETC